MNKTQLRGSYRQIRLRMSRSEVKTKSRQICRRLLDEIDWDTHSEICLYEPIASLNEVDITDVTSRLKAQRRDVEVLPTDKTAKSPKTEFDLIIIPCLAFDNENHRLGWGGGFYDRFLATQPQALKVGLAYHAGLVENGLPAEPHDIRLDKIITEQGII